MSNKVTKKCIRCNEEKELIFFDYYHYNGEKRWINNCKSCKIKKVIECKIEQLKCNRCNIIQPCTNFDVYVYKGERKRKKCCRQCRLTKNEKLPIEIGINKWLNDI